MSANSTEIVVSSSPPPSSQPRTSTSLLPSRTATLVTSAPPSVVPSTAVQPTLVAPTQPGSVVLITSVITESPASTGGTGAPSVLIVTSTASFDLGPTSSLTFSPTGIGSSSSTAPPLATSNPDKATKSKGLPQSGKIAVAVVVPIVVIALLVVGLLFLWKKRKATRKAKKQRQNEMEEYGYNPNHDPKLLPVSAAYGEATVEGTGDAGGYRGWGTTNSTGTRQPSANLESSRGGVGVASPTGGGNGGVYGSQTSPSNPVDRPLDDHSGHHLADSPGARPSTGDSDLGDLGAAPVAGAARQERGVHRGPSNASSSYSTGPARSEGSDDLPLPGGAQVGPYYHEDGPYANEGPSQAGAYGDNPYGGGQPVIRDVQARRNTRIEKPSVFPQQGNSGIAQNF